MPKLKIRAIRYGGTDQHYLKKSLAYKKWLRYVKENGLRLMQLRARVGEG